DHDLRLSVPRGGPGAAAPVGAAAGDRAIPGALRPGVRVLARARVSRVVRVAELLAAGGGDGDLAVLRGAAAPRAAVRGARQLRVEPGRAALVVRADGDISVHRGGRNGRGAAGGRQLCAAA